MTAARVASAPLIAFPRQPVGPDKQAFHRYLLDFTAEDEAALLEQFCDCTDALPSHYANLLFLPLGSTYRDAVRLLLTSWNGPFGGASEWHDEGFEEPDC